MNSSRLSYGLNLTKKSSGTSRSGPPRRNPIFGGGDDSDDDEAQVASSGGKAETILEFDDSLISAPGSTKAKAKPSAAEKGPPAHPPKSKAPAQTAHFGDLSSALTSRKYAEDAEKLDPSIYDYDASYDSFKAPANNQAKQAHGSSERKSQYMSNVRKMAEVRERDRRIAEDKKMQREREAEGDEYADKEKFVTEAYKKQQEENRLLEEEEKRREEEETKKNKSGGMTGFYKTLLEREDQRQVEITKAAEELQKKGPAPVSEQEEEKDKERMDADIARNINEHGGSVAINDEGQVVDKRQLLRGGLNVGSKKKAEVQKEAVRNAAASANRDHSRGMHTGGKQGMRDRQSRILEAQYEQALKRARDEEEEERTKVELASKSRKTDTDISSAKERYLARKKAEAEAKKNGTTDGP